MLLSTGTAVPLRPSDNPCCREPITASELPPDLNTTSIGLTVIQSDDRVVNEVLDEMLQYVTPDGMAMVIGKPMPPTSDPHQR